MQSRYNLLQEKKKRKWPYIVSGTVAGLLIGITVVWVAMNDWNIDKSIEELRNLTEVKQTVEEDGTGESIIEEPIAEEPVQEIPVKEEPVVEEVDMSGAKGYVGHEILPEEPTVKEGIVIASKKYPLPSTYAPGESKEARAAFQEMAAEATLSGYELIAFSTYRSFDYQTQLYDRYVTNDGQEAADRYSARPGYSEHQTGLAFDIGEQHFEQHFARESFGETEAGKWVAANAHKYGFIMRYPNGAEKITGYMYEPWHFRYIGEELALKVYEANVTLEEFLDL
ncbi:M15 family metallopeptidase [Psychrobacillus sp. FSL K6-2836]|uniref:M15 family metallopeptidase n=1 Tax=Psychrobacillus sp. FSL K6-2836 TaxID=2921548 RepID=UPI0030FB87E7